MPAQLRALGHPAGESTDTDTVDSVHVIAWPDPVIDATGFEPRSWYVEQFWLSVIGPTSTWLVRRLAAGLDARPGGFELPLIEAARALGVGTRNGNHSPLRRAMARCVRFELASTPAGGVLAVRRRIPPLARRHVLRLPPSLREKHEEWCTGRHDARSADEHRRRARRLALELLELGEERELAEMRLLRFGVHPSLAGEAADWAEELLARSRPGCNGRG